MSETEQVRKEIVKHIQTYYEEHKTEPSVGEITKEFKEQGVNGYTFYRFFPKGKAEACRLAGVPVSMELFKRTEKALKARAKARKNDTVIETPSATIRLTLTEEQTKRLLGISHLEGGIGPSRARKGRLFHSVASMPSFNK